MERKIGSIFVVDGKKYKVTPSDDVNCTGCICKGTYACATDEHYETFGYCDCSEREDITDVIFEEVTPETTITAPLTIQEALALIPEMWAEMHDGTIMKVTGIEKTDPRLTFKLGDGWTHIADIKQIHLQYPQAALKKQQDIDETKAKIEELQQHLQQLEAGE